MDDHGDCRYILFISIYKICDVTPGEGRAIQIVVCVNVSWFWLVYLKFLENCCLILIIPKYKIEQYVTLCDKGWEV